MGNEKNQGDLFTGSPEKKSIKQPPDKKVQDHPGARIQEAARKLDESEEISHKDDDSDITEEIIKNEVEIPREDVLNHGKQEEDPDQVKQEISPDQDPYEDLKKAKAKAEMTFTPMSQAPLIFGKIADIQEQIPAILKTREAKNNKGQKIYSFRGIDDVYNALNPVFRKHRVFITPEMIDRSREERKSSSGGSLNYTFVTMRYRLYAEDGSYIEALTDGEAMDSGDKSTNKAMSAAQKYALLQMFQIPTEESKDPENDTYETMNEEQLETYHFYSNELELLNSKDEVQKYWDAQVKTDPSIKDNRIIRALFIKRGRELS